MPAGDDRRLRLLARLYGVQTSFLDVFGERRTASPDVLLAVLHSLGAPLSGPGDVEGAVVERRLQRWSRLCEPVVASWSGERSRILLRLQSNEIDAPAWLILGEGSDEERRWRILQDEDGSPQGSLSARLIGSATVHGEPFSAVKVALPEGLSPGYHALHVETPGRRSDVLLILAPGNCHRSRLRTAEPDDSVGEAGSPARWGLFAPVYALRSSAEDDIGDLGHLARLVDLVAERRGRFVSTLPFLSCAHWLPVEEAGRSYSPYNPTSRLFRDERYLDLSAAARLSGLPDADGLIRIPDTPGSDDGFPADRFVHHGAVMKARRTFLASAAERFFANDRLPRAFDEWLDGDRHARAYASFAATQEAMRMPWYEWPRETLKQVEEMVGSVRRRPEQAEREEHRSQHYNYHLFVQWCLEQQLSDLAGRSRERGVDLMFDLPLGVPPHAYDACAWRNSFAFDATVGAPPDTFFRAGQNWGFAPQMPDRARHDHHDYFVSVVRHHLRHAGLLRLDHIMGLYRQYWIPEGCDAEQGVYVRYPFEEHLAILAVETAGQGGVLVGEDLGTVPDVVREQMRKRGVAGMYVVQSAFSTQIPDEHARPATWQAAMVNTHDMPLFASWWEDGDLVHLEELGHLSPEEARSVREQREKGRDRLLQLLRKRDLLEENEEDIVAIHSACLKWLAESDTRLLQINLEDLWGEKRPQNVPGTGSELPNWRGRMRCTLDEAANLPEVDGVLRSLGPDPGITP